MRSFLGRIVTAVFSGVLGLGIALLAAAFWTALLLANLNTSPKVPWAVPAMAVLLWLMWQYLGGKWWPRSTSAARRRYLRANPVSRPAFAWAVLAGVLAIVALAGYWILLFQLVKMHPNVLPDFSQYPLLTVALTIVMGSLVSPLSEEAGLRGYCQQMLEAKFSVPVAVVISSLFFALGHVNHGLLWPKLLVYFLVGVTFGAIARLTDSILPGIAVHIIGDLTFFILVWPFDRTRRLVVEGGADLWFWVHVAQTILFTALAIMAFRRLAKVSAPARTQAEAQSQA